MIKAGVMLNDRYEIIGRIGSGGMADVYKGRDHKLNRYVAVKVLKREFSEDELFVKKFGSEAQAAAGLMHPNIVNVYDVGEEHGLYFMVMELVEGITLKEYIQKKGRLTPKEVISITIQVCTGIEAAHNNHIVHRDIKPQNIIISKDGKVKVTDFGIAKATSSNTISTNAMGSVHYTSPEQARGGFSDAKSDVYSLGITMYEMITGELPFDGETTVSIAIKHLQEDITAPSELVSDIPYSLERIILKCTQKSPDRRYADMSQMIRDLKRSLTDPEGDFVTIAPFAKVADTVAITPEELSRIQREYEDSDDDYDDDDDYGDGYDDDYDDYDDDENEKNYGGNARKGKGNRSDVNPNMAKIMKILTIVVTVIVVFMLVFVVGKATGILKIGPGVETTKDKTKVPKLVGLTEEKAKEACKKAELELKVVKREESSKYEEGTVSEQKTAAGVTVPKDTVVQVVVSSGLKGEEIIMPNVSGLTESAAKDALIQKGFKASNIQVEYRKDNDVAKGLVIGTTPDAETKATEDTEINIIVSDGPEKVNVPKLVGRSRSEAESALAQLGLVGSATETYSDKTAGEVISQNIGEGEEVNKGAIIEYVVSKGPEPKQQVTVPGNLVGQPLSSVKATLKNMGLVVKEVYIASDQYYEDYVISVSHPGATVDEGTTIEVVISTGPGPVEPEPGDDQTQE